MDRLVIPVVPEPQARLAGLQTGEIDIAEPPLDDVEALQASGELEIVVAENTGQNVFWEFANRPPFDDARARQAVAHATDVETALMLVYGDLAIAPSSARSRAACSATTRSSAPSTGRNTTPPARRSCWGEMGYGPNNPLETTLIAWTGGKRDKLAEVFQAQLAQVGIAADIEIMDIGTMNARVRQGEREGPRLHRQGLDGHDDVVLVRPRHTLRAVALARRLSRLHEPRARRDAGAHPRAVGPPRSGARRSRR